MPKYQFINDPSIIVEAVQFDPHKQPWPDGVHNWDGKSRPRDMSWGYTETVPGRVHVLAGDYIVENYFGGRRVYHQETFEGSFRPIPQGGDATIPVNTQTHSEDALGQISKQYIREELGSLLSHYELKKKRSLKNSVVSRNDVIDALEYEAKIEAILEVTSKLGIELS